MDTVRDVALRYRFGELKLGSARFRMLCQPNEFLDRDVDDWTSVAPLESLAPDCDGVHVPSQPISERLPRLQRTNGYLRYTNQQFKRFYVDLRGSWDDYVASFSGKTRSTLRRKVRKFDKDGEVRIYKTVAELDEFIGLAREVSQGTYQEAMFDMGLPDSEEFRKEAAEHAANDTVRASLLFSEGKPIAYLYLPSVDGIVCYSYVGFNPEHRKRSPGTVLFWKTLESLFAEDQFLYFDFTEGEGTQKGQFATDSRLCADVYFLRPTLWNRSRVYFAIALDWVSTTIVRVLDRIGLKARVKAAIRRLATKKKTKDAPPAAP